ncbi:MAG: AAA family ATPase [Deinococcota bacterium]
MDALPYLQEIGLKTDKINSFDNFPFSLPSIASITSLPFADTVTFFVGENGTGKSTLIEAIAVAMGFNAEGGTKNFNFATKATHTSLHEYLRLSKSFARPRDGFFLRAETFYNVATNIDELDETPGSGQIIDAYGGRSLHHQSHGESFLSLVLNRFSGRGLYILDEPEAALSPSRQLTLLSRMNQLVKRQSQFIIATHSPILMAYPGAWIYRFSEHGLERVSYEETEHYQITKAFLNNPEMMLHELFRDTDAE